MSLEFLRALITKSPPIYWETPREAQLRARMKRDRSSPWIDVDPPTWRWPT